MIRGTVQTSWIKRTGKKKYKKTKLHKPSGSKDFKVRFWILKTPTK